MAFGRAPRPYAVRTRLFSIINIQIGTLRAPPPMAGALLFSPQGADSLPPPLRIAKTGKNHF
jgi:hypothetical protein